MFRSFVILTALAVLLLMGATVSAHAVDYWVSSDDAAVITNNDCGFISDVAGHPVIRRSFQDESQPGVPANVADRINSGDELVVPAGSRLEWTTGSNIIVTLGSGTRVRLDGLRSFGSAPDATAARLDVSVVTGAIRVQVRLNEERPDAFLASLSGADILVRRGDVEMFSDNAWRGAVLSGEASARVRRGGVTGVPFMLGEGQSVGAGGQEPLEEAQRSAIRGRLPFSFELVRAALPPLPPISSILEAP